MITQAVLLSMLLSYGVTPVDANMMVCIAQKESSMNPKAINHKNRNKTKDYGLFQINSIWIKECGARQGLDLLDLDKNMTCALQVYEKQGLKAWSTYRKCKGALKHGKKVRSNSTKQK